MKGGQPAEAPPGNWSSEWKHLGNGQYVSKNPASAYKTRPEYPKADNQTHMERPDWAKQYYKESNDSLDEIRNLAGIKR
jgi:hypothetical protein